jgi:XkdW protein.
MNLALAIMNLYPQANPLTDFAAQDDGPVFHLLVAEHPTKQYLLPDAEGVDQEDWIEGVHFEYRKKNPSEMTEGVEFEWLPSVPYIVTWNVKDANGNDVPKPTEQELQAAWEAYQALPIPKTPEELEEERLQTLETNTDAALLGVADAYEQQLAASATQEEQNIAAMLGLTEVYELAMQQQTVIEQLQAKIAQLEASQATGGAA